VVIDLNELVRDFAVAAERAGIADWSRQLRDSLHLEYLQAPHCPPWLPAGFGAVYAFALCSTAGESAPCRAGSVLKVGRVEATNKRRFRHSHYLPDGPRSRSPRDALPCAPVGVVSNSVMDTRHRRSAARIIVANASFIAAAVVY
jgi:hypothetical protein